MQQPEGIRAGSTVTIAGLTGPTLCAIIVTAWPQLPHTSPRQNTVHGDLALLMEALFHTEQVLIGQVGKYKIVKQLQKAVWLARYRPFPYSITI